MKRLWIVAVGCMFIIFVNIGCETKKEPQTPEEKELTREQEEINGLVAE